MRVMKSDLRAILGTVVRSTNTKIEIFSESYYEIVISFKLKGTPLRQKIIPHHS